MASRNHSCTSTRKASWRNTERRPQGPRDGWKPAGARGSPRVAPRSEVRLAKQPAAQGAFAEMLQVMGGQPLQRGHRTRHHPGRLAQAQRDLAQPGRSVPAAGRGHGPRRVAGWRCAGRADGPGRGAAGRALGERRVSRSRSPATVARRCSWRAVPRAGGNQRPHQAGREVRNRAPRTPCPSWGAGSVPCAIITLPRRGDS